MESLELLNIAQLYFSPDQFLKKSLLLCIRLQVIIIKIKSFYILTIFIFKKSIERIFWLLDVCLVTSIREGMNLSSMEFIACQRNNRYINVIVNCTNKFILLTNLFVEKGKAFSYAASLWEIHKCLKEH